MPFPKLAKRKSAVQKSAFGVGIYGPKRAVVAFIGAMPSAIEMARGELLVGPVGQTFEQVILKGLGLQRSEVVLGNLSAVPIVDADGKSRKLTDAEISAGRVTIHKALDDLQPQIVVALGKDARVALGSRAQISMPHPSAVRRFGDSGEVSRKLRQIRKRMQKQESLAQDISGRADQAMQDYQKRWREVLMSGGGTGAFFTESEESLFIAPKDEKKLRLVIKPSGAFSLPKDRGSYRIGVATQDKVEITLDGDTLNGSYILRADLGGALWLIEKPQEQTPIAEQTDLADAIRDLKKKNQDFLIWGKPGDTPQLIDVRTRKVLKSLYARFLKADTEKRIVSAVVLDPYTVDTQDDWIQPKEIRDTAHGWFKKSRVIGLNHQEKANAEAVESFLVMYPSPKDHDLAMHGKPHRAYRMPYGNDVVHSGAWIVDTELSVELMRAVKSGELTGYSIGGFGHKTPIKPDTRPEVEFIDLADFKRE